MYVIDVNKAILIDGLLLNFTMYTYIWNIKNNPNMYKVILINNERNRANNKCIWMLFTYANDENIEKWMNFCQKFRKSAFILHLYGYIWNVIINKSNGESLYTNQLTNINKDKFHWHLWIDLVLAKFARTWCVEYFTGITGINWMTYFPISYTELCDVISWNNVEQKTVKIYY